MQFLILAAGKPSLGYAKEGVELYLNRLRPFGKTELKLVRDGNSQDVSKRLLAASEGCLRIAMDERGDHKKAGRLGKGLANAFRAPYSISHRSLRRSYGRIAVPVQSYPVLEQIHPST